VCDKGLTLRDLIGTLKMFFDRLGLKKLRFKPAYNPYTEPSMEIFRSAAIHQALLRLSGRAFHTEASTTVDVQITVGCWLITCTSKSACTQRCINASMNTVACCDQTT